MTPEHLQIILKNHEMWLKGDGGERANLSGAYLSGANLRGANLRGANMSGAYLSSADLIGANLSGAYLSGANLRGANMIGANLSSANLSSAYLIGADLSYANLSGANMSGANLSSADLSGANLPDYMICPEIGSFHAFKSVRDKNGNKAIITLEIPAEAQRLNSIGSRKCRASEIIVHDAPPGEWFSPTTQKKFTYSKGIRLSVPDFCDDIREECAPGIHFFMTKKEAEEW